MSNNDREFRNRLAQLERALKGGSDGQVLAKTSDLSYQTEWVAGGGGGGGIPEAPNDSQAYVRQSLGWVVADYFSGAWADITGKPATFPPSAHTHVEADITDNYWALSGTDLSNTNTGQLQLLNTVVVDSLSGVGDRLVTTNNAGVLGTTAIPVIPDVYWEAVGSNIQNTNVDDVVIQENLLVSNRIGVNQATPTYEVDITKDTFSDNGVGVRIKANATTPQALVLAEQSSGFVWFGNDSGSFVAKTESLHGFPQFVIEQGAPQDTLVLLATGTIQLKGYTGAGGSLLGVDGAGEVQLVSVASTTDWTLSGTDLYPDSATYDVGIGTTSPTAKLDVLGVSRFVPDLDGGNILAIRTSDGSRILNLNAPVAANLNDPFTWATSNAVAWTVDASEAFRINSNGYVGVNTPAPARWLHATSDQGVVAALTGTNVNGRATIGFEGSTTTGGTNQVVCGAVGDDFIIQTSAATRVEIDSVGNVTLDDLSGTGLGLVAASSTGQLSRVDVPGPSDAFGDATQSTTLNAWAAVNWDTTDMETDAVGVSIAGSGSAAITLGSGGKYKITATVTAEGNSRVELGVRLVATSGSAISNRETWNYTSRDTDQFRGSTTHHAVVNCASGAKTINVQRFINPDGTATIEGDNCYLLIETYS